MEPTQFRKAGANSKGAKANDSASPANIGNTATGTASVDSVKFYKEGLAGLKEQYMSNPSGRSFASSHSDLLDNTIRLLFEKVLQSLHIEGDADSGKPSAVNDIAVIALGGYGRQELCPFSDIDIMILHRLKDKALITNISEGLFYPVWDLGLEVGHGTRTVKESLQMAADNFELQTAFLDGRVIAGNESILFELLDGLAKQLQARGGKKFLNNLLTENKRRYKQYGQAAFLIEPDLKEGEGGLRDIQAMQWAAKALLSCETIDCLAGRKYVSGFDIDALDEAFEFLLKVRTLLHFASGRKNDRLFFEQQVEISKTLGFKDSNNISGIERFMRVFYTNAAAIELVSRAFWSQVQEDVAANSRRFSLPSISSPIVKTTGPNTKTANLKAAKIASKDLGHKLPDGIVLNGSKLALESAEAVSSYPGIEIALFKLIVNEKAGIDYSKLYLIRDGIRTAGPAQWTDDVRHNFLSILAAGEAAIPVLETMGYIGIMNRYIPEWERIRCLPQHDAYHLYTVDAHSFLAVAHIKRIAYGEHNEINPLFKQTHDDVTHKDILLLATLLHDIGKGFGKGHSARGAQMAIAIAERMGLSEKETNLLCFLIEQHLLLADTAMRRDLGDENIIVEIAENVVTLERLRMLYLLSIADSFATGPKAWDAWKDSLLKELFLKVFHIIKSGEYTSKKSIEHHRSTTSEVRNALKDHYSENEIELFLRQMPPAYLLAQSSADIVRHFEAMHNCCDNSISITTNQKDNITEMVLVSKDEPGLFCKVSGVLALNSLNILGAQVYTRSDGLVLDIFKVEGYFENNFSTEKQEQIKNDIKRALEGKIALDYRIAEKAKRYKRPTALKRSTRVEIDNSKSDFYTVIEVHAQDRIGLLYTITKVMFDLSLDIHLAKVSTNVDKIIDVFYVWDIYGQVLTDKEQINDIKLAIKNAIG